jgi:hypothetical protein
MTGQGLRWQSGQIRNRFSGFRTRSIGKYDGLHARYVEPLAAAHVLAHHDIIFPQHIGASLREAGPVALVGAPRQLPLLGPNKPHDLILGGLVAMRTIQIGRFFISLFIEKIAFFHAGLVPSFRGNKEYYTYRRDGLWQDGAMPQKKKVRKFRAVKAVKELARERIGIPPAPRVVPDGKKKKTEKHRPTLERLLEQD